MAPGPRTRLAQIGRLRPAKAADLPAIIALEHLCFPSPWPDGAFAQELKNPWSSLELLERPSGELAAFVVYWVVEDELHLLDIAVVPALQRQGVGRQLMEHLEVVCGERGCTYVTLEVRESNAAAIALYEALGYSPIHRRKRYYVDNKEDALVMAKVLD